MCDSFVSTGQAFSNETARTYTRTEGQFSVSPANDNIRVTINDIRQMLHNFHDAITERGSKVGDSWECLMRVCPDIILCEQCFSRCPLKSHKQLPAPLRAQVIIDVSGDRNHTHPKSSHRNRKGHPMSIPGWLEKLPDGFGVVDAGLGNVEFHIDSLKVQY